MKKVQRCLLCGRKLNEDGFCTKSKCPYEKPQEKSQVMINEGEKEENMDSGISAATE